MNELSLPFPAPFVWSRPFLDLAIETDAKEIASTLNEYLSITTFTLSHPN